MTLGIELQILYFLIAHYVGDFLLQSRAVAEAKSHNWEALIEHIALYMFTFVAFGFLLSFNILVACVFAVWNGLIHFCIDAVTSRITSRLYKENKIYGFFAVIGLDQLLHAATIIILLMFPW